MSSSLEETLAGVGYAKVIVALKPTLAAASSRSALEQHFVIPSERQMESLIAAASRSASKKSGHPRPLQEQKMKVYPHLNLALGFVDRDGAAALAAARQVERVVEAPELSLIRPFASRAARLAAAPTWASSA
jgi:subtilisin